MREEKEKFPHELHTRDFTLRFGSRCTEAEAGGGGVPGQGSLRAGGIAEGHRSQALKAPLLINPAFNSRIWAEAQSKETAQPPKSN